MIHKHSVLDGDKNHFIIDSKTRSIKYGAVGTQVTPPILVKGDHNSEVFTFEVPKTIEGHDMGICDQIEIHYINIEQETRRSNPNVYLVNMKDDVTVSTDKLNFKWLLSNNTTMYAGSISFAVRFVCHAIDEDGNYTKEVVYAWNTSPFSGIAVSDGISNNIEDIANVGDIIQEWWNRVSGISEDSFYAITDDGVLVDVTERITNLETGLKQVIEDRQGTDNDLSKLAEALGAEAVKDEETGVVTSYSWTLMNNEATVRQEADNALQAQIDKEASDRSTTDNVLNGLITKEVANRENADNTLDQKIESEVSYRKSADTELSNRISALEETVGDDSTEGSLSDRISALEETVGDDSTEGSLSDRITSLEDENLPNRVSDIENIAGIGETDEYGSISVGLNSSANIGGVSIGKDTVSGGGVSIGPDSKNGGGIAIGVGAIAKEQYQQTIAIGRSSEANNKDTIALGDFAVAKAEGAVQIGEGTNNEDGTLQFKDYKLLSSDGKIPLERLSLDDINYTDFTLSNQFVRIDVGGYGTSDEKTLLTSGTYQFIILHDPNNGITNTAADAYHYNCKYQVITTISVEDMSTSDRFNMIPVINGPDNVTYALFIYREQVDIGVISDKVYVNFRKITYTKTDNGHVIISSTNEPATVWCRQIA